MVDTPTWLRLVIALAITIAVTLALVWKFHAQALALAALDQDDDDDQDDGEAPAKAKKAGEQPKPPPAHFLGGQVIRILAMAFVFLMAFNLGQAWSRTNDARTATRTEAADFQRAVVLAGALPAQANRDGVLDALAAYSYSVREIEWPMLQRAQADDAYVAHDKAVTALAEAMLASASLGGSESPAWDSLSASVGDMGTQGTDRINALPGRFSPGVLAVLAVLALANVVYLAVFQPTRLRINLFYMAVIAGITVLLMFMVVEASNPYWGAAAVEPLGFGG
ncbi:MAG: hypothetical protein RLZ55_1316 [Actinomycetota bacterium]